MAAQRQAASATLKMSPPYGYDTNAVILTMGDWPGRVDTNEKLMATASTMVFYTMGIDYASLFAQLSAPTRQKRRRKL